MSSPADAAGSRRGRGLGTVVTVIIIAVSAAAGWALKTVITPPPDVLRTAEYTTAEAVEGSVRQSLTLNAVASWKTSRQVANQAEGMVTSVDAAAGSRVTAGDVLYRVALHPVVVAQGEVPAFRDIGADSRGDDVRQMQEMLAQLGYYGGEADGRSGWYTVQAIKAWQRDLGVKADGVVRPGDVMFLPSLPAIVSYTDISVGQALSPGAGSVNVLGEAPEFTVSLTDTQARIVSLGTPVTLAHGDAQWEAVIAQVAPASGDTATTAELAPAGDGPICADICADLPVSRDSTVPAEVTVVPEKTGIMVPASSLTTDPDGQTVVVLANGAVAPVSVVASAQGSAVVEGIEAGEQVRVPGVLPEPDPGQEQAESEETG